MSYVLLPRAAAMLALSCAQPPPVITPGPDRPLDSILSILDPGAEAVFLARPADLLASPLGDHAAAWFRPTPEEAARGGPPAWFRDLGGASEAVVVLRSEGDEGTAAIAVRGGEAEAAAVARGFAAGVRGRGSRMTDEMVAGVRTVTDGTMSVAALARDVFVIGPRASVEAACRRAAGDDRDSLAVDPRAAPLVERLDLVAAQVAYVGRVPAALRPRLQHWGLDPLVDRIIGAQAAISARSVSVRLVADLDDAEAAAALAADAAAGIEFMANRRSFRAVGISPLIRLLAPRADGRFFLIEGSLPTEVVAALIAQLRAVAGAAGGTGGTADW